MKTLRNKLLTLCAAVFLCSSFANAQESQRERLRATQPTVTGGTGLFTVYDASTLKRGEFNVSYFANNFDRDPGDVDITQHILNFGIGVTDHLEVFAATTFRQQVSVERANELSGFLLPNVRFPGRPVVPVAAGGSGAGAPFIIFPGLPVAGALSGGVLPGLPQTRGFVPGYLNDYPYIADSNHEYGNTTIGAKYRFTSPESRVGVALIGFAEFPSNRTSSLFKTSNEALLSGNGSGNPDYGVILAVTPRFGRATVSMNLGAVKTTDPTVKGIKYLDRRNKAIASVGLDFPVNEYFQFVTELTSNIYYGSGTPNLNPVNPLDYTVGGRIFPFGSKNKHLFSLGGAYRYFVNNSADRRANDNGDYQGFVAHMTYGLRKIEPPDPCKGNVAPTVTVSADKVAVKEKTSESVSLTAAGKDPDPKDAQLTYNWSASSGSVSGNGSTVTWTPGSSAPGDVTITCTVGDTCGHSASSSTTVKVEKVHVNSCPTVSISASPSSVKEGSDAPISLSARGNDVDGDNLTYVWKTSRGTIEGSGSNVTLNTRGLSAGTVTISVTTNDGKCDSAPDSTTVTIVAPPPPPPVYTTTCTGTMYKRNISRVDNQCKAVLDGVADRLRSDPTALCIVDGHSDKGEKAGTAKARAEKVRAYLIEKGIDGNRIEVRSFDDNRPEAGGDAQMNCRTMIHVVPEGAKRPE
ncbi:MAG: OmpA family protein [Blastocatellia bacterium]|nr:OmpA family protein [Blastocatellia bacterium]